MVSLEHVLGSIERQVKCPLEPWPPLFLSTRLHIHSPMTPESGSVLDRTLYTAKSPEISMLGSTQGLWGLNAISEPLGHSWAARSASWETCQPQVLCAGRTLGLETLLLVTLWGNWIYRRSEDLKYLSHFVSPECSLPYMYFLLDLRHIEVIRAQRKESPDFVLTWFPLWCALGKVLPVTGV